MYPFIYLLLEFPSVSMVCKHLFPPPHSVTLISYFFLFRITKQTITIYIKYTPADETLIGCLLKLCVPMLIISKDDLKKITQFPYVLELGILLIFTNNTSKGFHHQRSVGETKTVFSHSQTGIEMLNNFSENILQKSRCSWLLQIVHLRVYYLSWINTFKNQAKVYYASTVKFITVL